MLTLLSQDIFYSKEFNLFFLNSSLNAKVIFRFLDNRFSLINYPGLCGFTHKFLLVIFFSGALFKQILFQYKEQ